MTKDRTVLLKPHPPLSKKFAGEDGVWRELVSGDGDPSELNEIKDKLEQLALLVLPDDYDGEILPEEVVEQTTRFILSISQEIVESRQRMLHLQRQMQIETSQGLAANGKENLGRQAR